MNIFDLIINSDLQTKLFIIISIVILLFIQVKLLKIKKLKYLFVLVLHIIFGFLLSVITNYNIIVHFVIYILPSFLIAFIVHSIKVKADLIQNEIIFTYKTAKGKNLTINENGLKRHFGVFGGSGSGKTDTWIKPTIKMMAQFGITGAIYDYKNFDLAKTAYSHYLKTDINFKGINFFDLPRSYRINPIAPEYIIHPAFANSAAQTIIANLTKIGENSDPWFVEAAESVLAGTIWKLKEDMPEYCYLPYVTSIITRSDSLALVNFLKSNNQAAELASPYIKIQKSERSLGSVEGTLTNALRKIALPDIYWILSGNEVHLKLNNPLNPTLLCISNNIKVNKSYAPVIALILDMSSKVMSEKGMLPSGFIIEEGSTIRLPNLAELTATVREYFIFVMLCIQDISQGEVIYNKLGFKSVRSNLGNQIYGRVMDMDTAENYAKMYGRFFKKFTTKSRRSTDMFSSNFSVSERQTFIKEPNEFLHLNEGHFFGIISKGNVKTFDNQFFPYTDGSNELDLPIINKEATTKVVQDNFNNIISKVKEIMMPFTPIDIKNNKK